MSWSSLIVLDKEWFESSCNWSSQWFGLDFLYVSCSIWYIDDTWRIFYFWQHFLGLFFLMLPCLFDSCHLPFMYMSDICCTMTCWLASLGLDQLLQVVWPKLFGFLLGLWSSNQSSGHLPILIVWLIRLVFESFLFSGWILED